MYYFVYSYDQGGRTPLFAAAAKGHERAVKELIAAGADINQDTVVSNYHILLLCSAIL